MGKGYILKVARVTKGMKCNSREVRLYHRVPSSLRKHLGKIVDHGDGWLIMRKIDKHLPKTRDYKKKVSKVYRKFKRYGVKISDIIQSGKPNKANIRVNKKRRVVLIDYANNRKHH
ncbi:hypothetical protein ACFQI7_22820 [Paenibacillus allorhizosphaerae]|nr:hypothetical protein [Paenibacillus allorhizosphaerae]